MGAKAACRRRYLLAQPLDEGAVAANIEPPVTLQPLFFLGDRGQIIPKPNWLIAARMLKKIKNILISPSNDIFQRGAFALFQNEAAKSQLAITGTCNRPDLAAPDWRSGGPYFEYRPPRDGQQRHGQKRA